MTFTSSSNPRILKIRSAKNFYLGYKRLSAIISLIPVLYVSALSQQVSIYPMLIWMWLLSPILFSPQARR